MHKELPMEKLETAFHVLKLNKASGVDDININVIKKVFKDIKNPLLFIFNLSINTGKFPDALNHKGFVFI